MIDAALTDRARPNDPTCIGIDEKQRRLFMTNQMRETLQQAAKQALPRVFDVEHGQPEWPAPHQTIYALERRGFLGRSERRSRSGYRIVEWNATEAGKAALKGPERVAVERPRFLARPGKNTGDYTNNKGRAIDHLEVAGQASLKWRRVAEDKRLAVENRRKAAGQAVRAVRRAA